MIDIGVTAVESIKVSVMVCGRGYPDISHYFERHGAHMSSRLATFGSVCGSRHNAIDPTSCKQEVHGRAAHSQHVAAPKPKKAGVVSCGDASTETASVHDATADGTT